MKTLISFLAALVAGNGHSCEYFLEHRLGFDDLEPTVQGNNVNGYYDDHGDNLSMHILAKRMHELGYETLGLSSLKPKQKIAKTNLPDDIFLRITFASFEPGEFSFGVGNEAKGKITYRFGFGTTPVTEWQFAFVMGENPRRAKPENPVAVEFQNGKIPIHPGHTLSGMSVDQIKEFIHRINRWAKNDNPLIYEIIPDHKEGDRYKLPFETEWDYVTRREHGGRPSLQQLISQDPNMIAAMRHYGRDWKEQGIKSCKSFKLSGGQSIDGLLGFKTELMSEGYRASFHFDSKYEVTDYFGVIPMVEYRYLTKSCNAYDQPDLEYALRRREFPESSIEGLGVGFRLVRINLKDVPEAWKQFGGTERLGW